MYESVFMFLYGIIKFVNNERNEVFKNFIESIIVVFICMFLDRLKVIVLMEILWSGKWKRVENYNDDR